MPLIDETYFVGELKIPNTDRQEVSEPLLRMIAHREKELLTDLLGYEMYKDFLANQAEPVNAALLNGAEYTLNGQLNKWEGLRNVTEKRSLIANYVYFHWQDDQISKTTGLGEKKPKAENA